MHQNADLSAPKLAERFESEEEEVVPQRGLEEDEGETQLCRWYAKSLGGMRVVRVHIVSVVPDIAAPERG
jgi:hypothetical protein